MAKYYGAIGFAETVETVPGVWEEKIVERKYYGDVLKNSRQLQSADQLNDIIKVANRISVVADPYAENHFHSIRYIAFCGAKWKVSDVTVERPRLILTLGGLWNGEQA